MRTGVSPAASTLLADEVRFHGRRLSQGQTLLLNRRSPFMQTFAVKREKTPEGARGGLGAGRDQCNIFYRIVFCDPTMHGLRYVCSDRPVVYRLVLEVKERIKGIEHHAT